MIHGKKRNRDLFKRLTENWGYTKPAEDATPLDEQMAEEVEDVVEAKDEEELEEGVFDANHYCIHHGGVHHNGSVEMAEAVQHVKPDANGHISHYDMKLSDGTILENVAAEDIQVTNASLAKEHMMKRDGDHKPMKDKEEDEELDERRGRGRDREGMEADSRRRPMAEAEADADIEEIEEMDMSRYTQSDSIDSHEVAQKLETLTGKVIDDDVVRNMLRAYGAGGADALEQFSSTVESMTGKVIDFDVLKNMLDHGTGVEIREKQEQNEGLEEAIRRVVSKVLSDIKTNN